MIKVRTVAMFVALLTNISAYSQSPPPEIDDFVLVMNNDTGIGYISKKRVIAKADVVEFETLTLLKQPVPMPGGAPAAATTGRQLLDCSRKQTRATNITLLSQAGEVLSQIETEKIIGVKWESVKPGTLPFYAVKLHCSNR